MGISFHGMWFLKAAASVSPLGEVLTFGRQNLNVSSVTLRRELGVTAPLNDYMYGESFILHLGATAVSSLDYSDFEGATFTADLNGKIDLGRQFDTVVDFGTSEHVFDVAAAFRNAVSFCKPGGMILHAVPSNSCCGHGFYQFAPELFFSLYSEANGFHGTIVYVADLMEEKHWWLASPPKAGQRLMVNSPSSSYILCRSKKARETSMLKVQQSDYEHAWEAGRVQPQSASFLSATREKLKGTFAAHIATIGYRTWLAKTGITRFNPNLQKVSIASQVR